MDRIIFLFVVAGLLPVITDAVECETGWTAYKDELCVTKSTAVMTYEEARLYCSSKGNHLASTKLFMVKDAEAQEFLVGYIEELVDNAWLGGKYDNETGMFKWVDGDLLTYTNWADGFPKVNACIQLRPVNSKDVLDLDGKWEDTSCQRRNLALCQRTASWSMEEATLEIVRLRKELVSTRQEFTEETEELRSEAQILQTQLDATNARVVPVGSLYVEYFNQPSPVTLWPTLTWADVTSSYAGMFFRAFGGSSGDWGENQEECAPRLSQVEFSWSNDTRDGNDSIAIPENGWSHNVWSGNHITSGWSIYEKLRFNVQGCESRPRNQAVRLWKRTK